MKVRLVGNPQNSPDGKTVAFTVGDVRVSTNKTVENNKVKAHVAKQLLYRHWTEWREVI